MVPTRFLHRLWYGVVVFILLLMVVNVSAQEIPEKKRVMVLHRQWEATGWEMSFNDGLFAGLNNDPMHPVSITYEFLTLENISESKTPDEILAYLRYKVAVKPVDLVIAMFPAANTFLLEYGDEIFPGVPKVFVLPSDENIQAAQTLPRAAIVQSASTQALRKTVQDIFTILPETQNLVVINGVGETDDVYRLRAEAAINELADPSVHVEYLTGLPLDELLVQISQLPDHSAILFVSYSADRNGTLYSVDEILPSINEAGNAPRFGFVDSGFGKGTVGGNHTSARLYGESAAEVGWQLLTDPSFSGLLATEGQTADYYDWRQLQRWSIPEDRLPPGSQVYFKTESFWEMYKSGILAVICIIVLQSTLIIALVVVLRQRRQAELARQQSEKRYRLLAENVADVVWILQADTTQFTYVSPSVERLLGFTSHEMLSKSLAQIIEAESLAYIEQNFPKRLERFLAGDKSALAQVDEIAQLHKDGTIVWTEVSTTLVRTEQGKIEAVGVSRDIRQRRQAAEALRESEERFRLLFEGHDAVMLLIAPDSGDIVDANPAAAHFYGYPRDVLCGMKIDDINCLSSEQVAAERQNAKTERRNYFVFPHRLSNGEIRTVEVHSSPIERQGEIVLFSIIRDITQRRQMEIALLESEEKYRTLVERSNDGLIIIQDGLTKFVNTRLADLLGYTVDEMLNTNSFDYVIPDQRARVQDIARRRFQGEAVPNIYETVLQRKNGEGLEVEMNAGLIVYEGKPSTVAFIRDITERKYLEAASRNAEILRIELEKEKEIRTLKERFVTTVSHEFRTPLAIIQTSVGLLNRYYTKLKEERRQELFHQVDQQIADMVELMDNTLIISQSQDGKTSFNPSQMNIEVFCRAIFEKTQSADRRSHRFEFISQVSDPVVMLDSELLQHILSNLLMNAVKYTPENGKISLVLDQTADEIILEVRDEGIGIPEADMPRLFEPFHRASNVGNISGTGLGLAIARQYMVLYGGQIKVDSTVGQGSTFRVILPLNRQ